MTNQNDIFRGELILYKDSKGKIELDVRLEQESIWLSQKQMSLLFQKNTDTIGFHLGKIYDEGELDEIATTEDSSVVQKEGTRQVRRKVRFYNLDAIISVGYRVNSKRGTQFRIWATGILRDHLLKGFSVNQNRLQDLNQGVRLIVATASRRDLSGDEARALLQVVGEYNQALSLLDDYDHQRIKKPRTGGSVIHELGYAEALRIIGRLRSQFGESTLFGIEKDRGLESSLGAVMLAFDGHDLYPSLEEKAANLIYFLVKNHAFVDGNKRIGAALFLWFLECNGILVDEFGVPLISNAALVAMTLMIAESHPEEKEVLVRIVTHLLCKIH